MYLHQTLKCLSLFKEVYVSSDDDDILEDISLYGAIPIKRSSDLCGDVPNIPVYLHALDFINTGFIAVQVNSPSISNKTIVDVIQLMQLGFNEVMTCHPDYSLYGSVWAMTKERLLNYKDPYKPTPEVLVVDNSIDIHTLDDYNKAICQ